MTSDPGSDDGNLSDLRNRMADCGRDGSQMVDRGEVSFELDFRDAPDQGPFRMVNQPEG